MEMVGHAIPVMSKMEINVIMFTFRRTQRKTEIRSCAIPDIIKMEIAACRIIFRQTLMRFPVNGKMEITWLGQTMELGNKEELGNDILKEKSRKALFRLSSSCLKRNGV